MDNFSAQLLSYRQDDVLFAHGGCHVFASVLHDRFGYPLISIKNEVGGHDHVACEPVGGTILDVYGWFSFHEYVKAEWAESLGLSFRPISREQLVARFTLNPGKGYYAHVDFMEEAKERARRWIEAHEPYFDGTAKVAIPGLSRVKTASEDEIARLWE